MNSVTLWYSIRNNEDSAYLRWFLSEEGAKLDQNNQDVYWNKLQPGSITSIENSEEHREAQENNYLVDVYLKYAFNRKVIFECETYNIVCFNRWGPTLENKNGKKIYLSWEELKTNKTN